MPGTGRRNPAQGDETVGSGNDVDSNQRQPGPGAARPDDQRDGPPPGRWAPPPDAGNPNGWNVQPPYPGQAPYPNQPPYPGQPPAGAYPPEHQPWARPASGDPNARPGGQPGYPPPGGYQPYPGQPGPSSSGQPAYAPSTAYPQPPGQPQYPPRSGPAGQPIIGRTTGGVPGFSAGPPVAPTIGKRKGSILPALFFGVLAVVLGVLAVYLYFQERGTDGPVAPTALPAHNQYANVNDALEANGLNVVEATRTDPGATSPSSFPRGTVGQFISIEGQPAWIFIFPDADTQQTATDAFTAAPEPLKTASGKPLTTGPPDLISNSNVILLLSMDGNPSQDVRDRVQQAVESLP